MQVKVFESADMASGLKMVKDELGPDALILSTKTVRSGKFGLLGKNSFEITAAVDSNWEKDEKPTVQAPQTYNRRFQLQEESPKPVPVAEEITSPVIEAVIEPVIEQAPAQDNNSNLQSEVDELKGMIKNLGREMTRMHHSQNRGSSIGSTGYDSLDLLQQRILDLGINSTTAKTITALAKESLTIEELTDPFARQQYISDAIEKMLYVSPTIFHQKDTNKQHRLALVGPTGVGKTTSLAKLAANYIHKHSPSIGFITIDTYRIAAVEQLKVYGEIMNVPLEVVLSPEQFEHALLKMRDKDLILIDTAGRSPQDKLCIDELASFLQPDLDIEKHLVLSATTRENELYSAMDRFSVLDINHTIITKVDECTSLGILLNLQTHDKKPFSFITNGQRVPEDIMEADNKTLTSLIMASGEGSAYE